MTKKDKTIFITLSSPMVFRNLFFFPGSFFEQFKKVIRQENDFKIILLMPFSYQKKCGDFFEKNLKDFNDKFIIELIDFKNRKNLLQKIFHFFYSYLIYTGTTKTLATVGMRPDEPPGGGAFRRYLAPLKILVSKTFGRWRFFKIKAVPYFYNLIFRKRIFSSLFDKYQPDIVFLTHLFGPFDAALLAEAKRRKTKTIGMISNWDHFDKYYLPFKTDKILAQSEQVKTFAMKYQDYEEKQIHLVGYPHFDFLVEEKNKMPRKNLLESLNFTEESKYILYVSGSAYCPDEPDIIETILKWIDEGKFGCDMRLVIRPYLGGRSKDKDFDEQKFNRFESHPKVTFYRKEFWGDLEKSIYFVNILRHADVVIAIYSTAAVEASVFDKPLVTPAFDGYKKRPFKRSIRRFELREHFRDILETGAMKRPKSFEELFEVINESVHNPNFGEKERKALRQKVCYKLDGLVSKRILDHVINYLG